MGQEQEIAEALGFSSVEQMNEHQVWIADQRILREKIRERVMTSGDVVDVRDLMPFEQIHYRQPDGGKGSNNGSR